MKKLILFILAISLFSCSSKPNNEEVAMLNGYWEIEKVEFPDGNKKEYNVNEFIEFINIKNNKGFKQKIAPQLDGTYLKGTIDDKIMVLDSLNALYLKTTSKYTKWKEKLISISENKFVVENEAKIVYHYKKFIPYEKR